MIFAIDPGNEESAFVVLDDNLNVIDKGKITNEELLEYIYKNLYLVTDNNGGFESNIKHIAIEMVASYGMAVGKTVFDTCVWIGRFYQAILEQTNVVPKLIYRKDEKMCICGTMKAKDSNIVQALVDRFAPNTPNKGKGTKKEQGFFYGFKKDIWQAMAVAITYNDMYLDKTTRVFM